MYEANDFNRPPFSRIFQEALHKSWTAYCQSWVVPLLSIAGGLVLAYFLVRDHSGSGLPGSATLNYWSNAWSNYSSLQNLVLGFAAMAACVRIVRPDFRMTFVKIALLIGISFLVGILAGLATVALIIPGIWVGVRLSLAGYVYLLDGGPPIGSSWELTDGYFWQTLGYIFCLVLLQFFAMAIVAGAAFGFLVLYPLAAFVMFPMMSAIMLYTIYIYHAAMVMLTDTYMQRAAARTAAFNTVT